MLAHPLDERYTRVDTCCFFFPRGPHSFLISYWINGQPQDHPFIEHAHHSPHPLVEAVQAACNSVGMPHMFLFLAKRLGLAYQSIFKHIRSVSQAIYQTSIDPTDVEMGNTKEFRAHLKKLLSNFRLRDVTWQEVDVLLNVIRKSADQLRQQKLYSDETSEEKIYRKLFESLAAQDRANLSNRGAGGADGMAGTATGGTSTPLPPSSSL